MLNGSHPLAALANLLGEKKLGTVITLEELGFGSHGDPEALGFRQYAAPAPGVKRVWCQEAELRRPGSCILHLCRDEAGTWYARLRRDWHANALPRDSVSRHTGECLRTPKRLATVLRVPVAYQALYALEGGQVLFDGEALLCFRFGKGPEDEGVRVARVFLDDDRFRFAWYSEHVQVTLAKALRKGTFARVLGLKRIGQTPLKEWLTVSPTVKEAELKVVPWYRSEDDTMEYRPRRRQAERGK